MIPRCRLAAAMAAICLWPGCGPAELPYTDNSQDPLAYARDVKTQVQSAARNAKSSNEPADYLSPVLQELKRTDRPRGESGLIYDDLRARLDQLVADCQRSGRAAPNLAQRLEELTRLAETLPEPPPATEDASAKRR